jgi:hypothetical protein
VCVEVYLTRRGSHGRAESIFFFRGFFRHRGKVNSAFSRRFGPVVFFFGDFLD